MKLKSMSKNVKRVVASLVSAMMVFSWVCESGINTMIASAEEVEQTESVIELAEEDITDSEYEMPEEGIADENVTEEILSEDIASEDQASESVDSEDIATDEVVGSEAENSFSFEGKEVASVSVNVPYSTLYEGIDYSLEQSLTAVRFKFEYTDGSSQYFYNESNSNGSLIYFDGDTVLNSNIYMSLSYFSKNESGEYISCNQYNLSSDCDYRITIKPYTYINGIQVFYQEDIIADINVVNPVDVEDVPEVSVGEDVSMTRNAIYSETGYFSYDYLYKVKNPKDGYVYSYQKYLTKGSTSYVYYEEIKNIYFRFKTFSATSNFRIRICENLPVKNVEYYTASSSDKLIYYVGINGLSCMDYYKKYFNLFCNRSLFILTLEDDSTFIYSEGLNSYDFPGYVNVGIYDSDGNYCDYYSKPLKVGTYKYKVNLSFYKDSFGMPIYIEVPFEVHDFSELDSRAVALDINKTASINKFEKKGDYSYLKVNLDADKTYGLSATDGYFRASLYDCDGNLVNENVYSGNSLEVNESGKYYIVIDYAYFYEGCQNINIKLIEKKKITDVQLDTTVPYRDTQYLGLYAYFNDYYPVGAQFTVTYSDNSTKTFKYDSYNSQDYEDFRQNYISNSYFVDQNNNRIDYNSISEAGTYYYRIEFRDTTEVLSIPINVLDTQQIEALTIGETVNVSSPEVTVMYYDGYTSRLGSPIVRKVELENESLYRFISDTSMFITLYDAEWNQVVGYNKTGTIYNTTDSISYNCEKTGIYYLCIENWGGEFDFYYEESVPITKLELDSGVRYNDIYYVGIGEDYYDVRPVGANIIVTYADGKSERVVIGKYTNSGSVSTQFSIVDSDYSYIDGLPTIAGDYFYKISIDGYDTPLYLPLSVKDFASSSFETIEEGTTGVRVYTNLIKEENDNYGYEVTPSIYKINLVAGKSYYFNIGDSDYTSWIKCKIYDSAGNQLTDGTYMRRSTQGCSRYELSEYVFKAETTGVYYVVIDDSYDDEFTFSYYEVPEIQTAYIASQPYVTEFYSGLDDIKNKYKYGLSVALNYVDGTSIIAYINDFAKYGISTALVDEEDNVVWSDDNYNLYYNSVPVGTYRVRIVISSIDLVMYTNELHVVYPVYESISIGESKEVSSNANYKTVYLARNDSYYINIGDAKLYKVSLEAGTNYQFSLNKYDGNTLTLYDQSFNVVTVSNYSDMFYSGRSGTYYVGVSTYDDVTLSIVSVSDISKIEVTKQPKYVGSGLSVADNINYYYIPYGMELKVTYSDGHTVHTSYGDALWNILIRQTNIVSTSGKKYSNNGWQADRCNTLVDKDDVVRFALTINKDLLADTVIESEAFNITTDRITNSKYSISTKYTNTNPLTLEMDEEEQVFYTINCEKGRSYILSIDGGYAELYKVTNTANGHKYSYASKYAASYTKEGYLTFDGISASEGSYCIMITRRTYDGNSSPNVKISLVEHSGELVKYEGMSLTLENGKVRLNAYCTIDDAYASKAIGWYNGAGDMSPVKDTITVDGVRKAVYRFSAYISADNLNADNTLYIQLNDSAMCSEKLSIIKYVQEILENKSNKAEYTKAQPLVNAVVNYGQYMEEYFSTGNFDEVRYNTITKTNRAGSSETIATINAAASSHKDSTSFSYVACSLILHETTSIKVYFKNNSNVYDYDDLMEKYDLYIDGEKVEEELYANYDEGLIWISCDGIDIQDINTPVTIAIVNKSNASDKASVTYCPMNYISTVLNNSSAYSTRLVKPCRAMYFYMDEAKKYKAA